MSELYHKLKAAVADRYQLEIELGSGGMATVYLAVDRLHQRRVALKILHPRLAGAVGHDRFLQEIRFAAELTHPHILPLLDSGTVTIDDRTLPYYVMPFVEGESLRARLQRQKQLPIEEALAIARDVAAALSYAHAHKVVHRDIKPENILLAGHEAVVADFGIARAINRAAESEVITTEGMAVGTPAYMSPEQSLAVQEIDGRTDIYSLGCVMYEMLGGTPPFTGGTPQAIVARHQMDPVPSLTTIRPTVPIAFELIIKKSLQKQPADRFQSADELVRALNSTTSGGVSTIDTGRFPGKRRLWLALAALLVLSVGTLLALLGLKKNPPEYDGQALDTTRLAILSIEGEQGLVPEQSQIQLLHDAFGRWRGITIVDQFQVSDAITQRGAVTLGSREWRDIAAGLGAGRYVRGDLSRVKDSIRIHLVLYDTRGPEPLADLARRMPTDLSNAEEVYRSLVQSLLFRSNVPGLTPDSSTGTNSAPARQAFETGKAKLNAWDLKGADSSFGAATRFDDGYADGVLWLALVRLWSGQDLAAWQTIAERAATGRLRLSSRDQLISDAVLAAARGDVVRACERWERLTLTAQHDFVSWYGRGHCLHNDDVVIRDTRSPTGWRFRSSFHSAIQSFRRAFQLLPSIHKAFNSFTWLTSATNLRGGRAAPGDTTTFLAAPSWIGDSLVFYPIPAWQVAQGRSTTTPTTPEAIRQQRQVFHNVAKGWLVEFPRSAQAMEALAIAMEMLGDRSALDTLRRAVRLATDPAERLRIASKEVWMRVRFSFPSDTAGLETARRLADSLLLSQASVSDPDQPRELATLAALTGQGHLAARFITSPRIREEWDVPAVLAMTAPPFIVYASLGGPRDTLIALERAVSRIIDQELDPSLRPAARLQWLAFAASMAFPEHQLPSISSLKGKGDYLIDAQAAFQAGDTTSVLRILQNVRINRRMIPAADLAVDALYPEAALLADLGRHEEAANWLDPTLTSLPSTALTRVNDAFKAASLIRAAALRALLAERSGDHSTAKVWASAVVVMWSHADDYLQPVVQEMRALMQ